MSFIDIVFDAPADESGYRFVEVEDPSGASIEAGEWSQRADGYWQLRVQPNMPTLTEAMRAVLRNDHGTYASEDELYAALVEAAGVSLVPQWQPIDTAPKDGSEIIIFHPEAGVCAAFCPKDGFAWHCMDGSNTVIGSKSRMSIPRMTSFLSDPTHWMPLPAAPTEGA